MKGGFPVATFRGRMEDLLRMGYSFQDALLFALLSFPQVAVMLIELLKEEYKDEITHR